MFRKLISIALTTGMFFNQSGFVYATGELNLSSYLSQMHTAIVKPDIFQPARLRYFSYDNLNNSYKILLDKGDTKFNSPSTNELTSSGANELKETAQELMDYFLIGVTLPNDTFWVNLRPDAPDTIIDPELERTDIGKVFLEADLQLKKDTASFTSPQTLEGKGYWDKLYKKAGELFGSENITIPTLTRPWIVPNEVIVRETDDSAYVYKATLKVLLEEDYLKSSQPSAGQKAVVGSPITQATFSSQQYNFKDSRLKELNEYSTQLIRETIIPKLTREVNSSQRYAKLRQVYYSLILSRWFKNRFGKLVNGLASEPVNPLTGSPTDYTKLIDSRNLTNLTSQAPWDKTTYFNQYKDSFNQGEYNIKEPVFTPYGQSIRSYTSGGIGVGSVAFPFEELVQSQGAVSPIQGGSFLGRFNKTFFAALLATGMFLSGSGNSFNTIVINDAKEVYAAATIDVEQMRSEMRDMLNVWDKNNAWYQSKKYELNFYRLFFDNDTESVAILIALLEQAEITLRFYEPSKADDEEHKEFMRARNDLIKMIESWKENNKNSGGKSSFVAPVRGDSQGENALKAGSPLQLDEFKKSLRSIYEGLGPMSWPVKSLPREVGQNVVNSFFGIQLDVNKLQMMNNPLGQVNVVLDILSGLKTKLNTFKQQINDILATEKNIDQKIYDDMGSGKHAALVVLTRVERLELRLKNVAGSPLIPREKGQGGQTPAAFLTKKKVISEANKIRDNFLSILTKYNVVSALMAQEQVIDPGQRIKDEFVKLGESESISLTLKNIEILIKTLLKIKDSYMKSLAFDSNETKKEVFLEYDFMMLNLSTLFLNSGEGSRNADSRVLPNDFSQSADFLSSPLEGSSALMWRTLTVPIYKKPYTLHYVSAENSMDFVLTTLERPVELYTFDNRKVFVTYISERKSDRIRLALGAGDRVVGVLVLEKKARILTNVSGKTLDINKALIIAGMSELLEADRDKEPIVINNELTSLHDDLLHWLNDLLGEKILEKKDELIRIGYSQAEAIVKNWQKITGVSEILSAPYLAVDPPLLRCQKDVIIDALDAYGKNAEFIAVDVLKEVMNEKLAGNPHYADNEAIMHVVHGLTPADGGDTIAETLASWITEMKSEEIEKDAQMQERDEFLLKVMKEYFSLMALKVELALDEKAEQELTQKNDKLEHLFEKIKEGNYFRPEEKAWLNDFIFKEGLNIKEGFLIEAIKITRGFLGRDTGYELPRERYKILSFSIGFVDIAASSFVGSSSALSSDTEASFSGQKRGGLDFTDEVMEDATTIERRGSFAELDLELPLIRDAELINLDNEYSQIQATIKAGIVPNGLRILEFIAACYQRNEFQERLSSIIVCLNGVCKLEELLGKETSSELRRALLAPDMLYAYPEYARLN